MLARKGLAAALRPQGRGGAAISSSGGAGRAGAAGRGAGAAAPTRLQSKAGAASVTKAAGGGTPLQSKKAVAAAAAAAAAVAAPAQETSGSGLLSKKGAAAVATATASAAKMTEIAEHEQQQQKRQNPADVHGQKTSVEEQRRRKRAERFAEENSHQVEATAPAVLEAAAASKSSDSAHAAVDKTPVEEDGAVSIAQVKPVPEQQRRQKRAERFGGEAGGTETQQAGLQNGSSTDAQATTVEAAASSAHDARKGGSEADLAGPAAKRQKSLLSRALGAALTVSTGDADLQPGAVQLAHG